jgi:hypothetical protein
MWQEGQYLSTRSIWTDRTSLICFHFLHIVQNTLVSLHQKTPQVILCGRHPSTELYVESVAAVRRCVSMASV